MRTVPNVYNRHVVFTSNGVWLCPADVTSIVATGFGGGGGGAGANTTGNTGGGGGGGSLQSTYTIPVVPGTLYQITIGAGGATVGLNGVGKVGGDTIFQSAGGTTPSVYTWGGASGGYQIGSGAGLAGCSHKATGGVNAYTAGSYIIAGGGQGAVSAAPTAGARNVVGGFDGGAVGATATNPGGGGGGAGPEGAGAAGGSGGATVGVAGSSAAANTGAGGGGGGNAGSGGGGTPGGGGAGGSGKLYLDYASAFPNPTLPKIVQFVQFETSNGQPLTPVFTNNVTPGNAIVVVCTAFANSTPVVYNPPTDAEGNKYTEVNGALLQDSVNQFQGDGYVAFNVVGGSTDTVTVTYSGGAVGGGNCVYLFEVSGLLGIEGGSVGSSGSIVANATTGLVPMTKEFGLVICCSMQTQSTDPTHPNGLGFILIARTSNDNCCLEYATGVSTPIAGTVLMQGSGSQYGLIAVGFNGTN